MRITYSWFVLSMKHASVKNSSLTSPPLLPIFFFAQLFEGKRHKTGPTSYMPELWDLLTCPFLHLQLGLTKTGLFHPIYNWWRGPVNLPLKFIPSWWLNHPIWKICASQIGSFPWTLGWQFSQPTGGSSPYLATVGTKRGFLNHQPVTPAVG